MNRFLPFAVFFVTLTSSNKSIAAPLDYAVAQGREYAHYSLDKIQQRLLAIDGKADDVLAGKFSEAINHSLTQTATVKMDSLQKQIELDSTLNNTEKLTYLRGLGEMINYFSEAYRTKKLKLPAFTNTFAAWQSAFVLDKRNQSFEAVFNEYPHAICNILLQGISFSSNPGIVAARNRTVLKYIEENPGKIWQTLNANPGVTFADSLLPILAKREPEKLYTYSQAGETKFGQRIQQNQDPLVKQVYTLANDNSGRLYFPFLDILSSGKITIADIKKEMADTLAYYKLLVRTQIDYAGRMVRGDTPLVAKTLQDMVHTKSVFPFINSINGLHDMPANIRFKKIEKLTYQELYYLIVSSEAEIYTSSYLGAYNRIWQRMVTPSADSLLASVNGHHYKKFIAMAANYNTLDNFLGRMSKANATALMTNFVNNLDKGPGNDLEDAVDVANSYASIKNDTLKKLMLDQISANYNKAVAEDNQRGKTIYRLEQLILESSDTSKHINLTDSLGILPVYDVQNSFMKDSLGRIVLQMYFYGDGISRASYNLLKNMYSNKNWKRTDSAEWVQFTSLKTAVPFVIFANRPGYEEKNEDILAQEHLNAWMQKNNYAPAITVHRGHSYYLSETVRQLAPSSKIIILGSCGAYHSLREILEICPDAYLIGSKQTGFGKANVLIFSEMVEELKKGKDINWITYWKLLQKKIPKTQYDFNDYIPPYKNLGAIFINAYNRQVN
ncbi:MAG: hypothetical protein V4722_04520 [Bacteroidota bacterium]